MLVKCVVVLVLMLPGVAVNAPWGPVPSEANPAELKQARGRLTRVRETRDLFAERGPASRRHSEELMREEEFTRRRVVQALRPPWRFHMPLGGPPRKTKVWD